MKITKIISQVEVEVDASLPSHGSEHRVNLIGILQYGFRGATTYTLNSFDITSIKSFTDDNTITRDAVYQWIKRRWSDLREIEDFSVTIGDGEFDSTWQREESEQVFCNCMYGDKYDT